MVNTNNQITQVAELLSKDGSRHVTDELVNTVTAIAGASFALLGSAILIAEAAARHQVWGIVGFSIYGLTLVNLFVSSALHHGISASPKTNRRLRTLDYLAVFLLIAGTITPLILVRARNPIGWSVFGAVWTIAILGIVLRGLYHQLPKFITNTLYIVLGWLAAVVVAANLHFSIGAFVLLAVGGLIYSFGFALFVREKPNIKPGFFGFHELWHCLVILGAACHYFLMYFYVLAR